MTGLLMGSTRDYFGVHAAPWDELRRLYYSDRVADLVLERSAEGKLLDVGCGPGFLLLKALASPRFPKVTGVDFTNSMLQLLRAKHENGHKLHLRLADARRLPFAPGTFDAAVSNMALHHLAEPWLGLSEMARVIRPGGTVVFSDLRPHEHAFFRDELADAWLGFEEGDVRRWMSEAGLESIEVEDAGDMIATVVNGKTREAQVRVFVARGVRAA